MKRMNFPGRRELRQQEALARQAKRDGMSDQTQLDRQVAEGFANGKEAVRLRTKLLVAQIPDAEPINPVLPGDIEVHTAVNPEPINRENRRRRKKGDKR